MTGENEEGRSVVDVFREEQAADVVSSRDDASATGGDRRVHALGAVTAATPLMAGAMGAVAEEEADAPAPELDASWVDAMPARKGWRSWLVKAGIKVGPGAQERKERQAVQRAREERYLDIQALRAEASGVRNRSSFITVFSRKGGVGKTTTSALLALALARIGQKNVALCEVNPDQGTSALKMGTPADKGIQDMVHAIRSGRFEGAGKLSPKAFMPKVPDFSINVLGGSSGNEGQRNNLTAEDVAHVAREVSDHFDVTILDNGTGMWDKGAGWDKKAPIFGSLAVSHSLVLIASSDAAESERFINSTLLFLQDKIAHDALENRRFWSKLRENVMLIVVDKEPQRQYTAELPDGKTIRGSRGALETYQRFQLGKLVRSTVILPHDPALMRTPIPFTELQPATLAAVREMGAEAWRVC